MITVLQNQHICKRKRSHIQPLKKHREKSDFPGKLISNTYSSQHVIPGRHVLTLPIVAGIILFLFCLFLSSPHIFSLTLMPFSSHSLQLPAESSLMDFPDGYEFVDNLLDEREYGVINIVKSTQLNKENPTNYIIKSGDTIYSISKEFDISLYDLLRENRISDPTKLKIGDILKFPVLSRQNNGASRVSLSGSLLPEEIEISARKNQGFAPFKVTLSLNTKIREVLSEKDSPDPVKIIRAGYTNPLTAGEPRKAGVSNEPFTYMWVLGNDRYCFDKEVEYVYETPGDYHVFLVISDKNNAEVVSNTVSIRVKKKNARKLHIESNSHQYITINQVNEILDLSNLIGSASRNNKEADITIKQSPKVFQSLEKGKLLSIQPGYSTLTITAGDKQYISHVFISPVPSKHSYEPPFNWYKTQFATGINGNCGPACVAMAIHWAKGEDISVARVRSEIGMPHHNGAVSFGHMFPSFKKHGVKVSYAYPNHPGDVRKIIDQGNIAIVVFNTKKISKTKGDPKKNLTGRYYNDTTGHYCIIKGYTTDGKYFIVYDPIPSDWTANEARYADGVSMLGRNRYYLVSELYKTMKKKVIKITR